MPGFTFDGDLTLSIAVRDRKASQDWYADRLGFELMYDAPEIGWCEMRSPVARVSVGFADAETVTPGGPVPVIGVTDIGAARAELEAKGVAFDGETQHIEGLVMLATFHDPDGHAWMLSQNLAGG
jgi:CreA protein